ncbi:N-formylglutamate amidohydrolase [Sphingomonas sp.]|uniref:N-formylglutamate amidohydrolase n=1 Tax=Sphingomonas sp. TaxID=28214 RepID=UPI0025F2F38F|nr:N-formylglutamate amidohydrolase [Sphingomonas sp.]
MALNAPHFEVGDPSRPSLLAVDDPPPWRVINPLGASSFLLLCDHAGNRVPTALGTLGLGADDLTRHIGWDIGAAGLSAMLAEALDATLVQQTYSRLVVDCNRGPTAADSVAVVSDGTRVPGNEGLSDADRAVRVAEIHEPYHAAIGSALASRTDPVLVAIHSFTPAMNGVARPWEIGVLHHLGNTDFAQAVLARLRETLDVPVGDNEPYAMDGIDYTVPRHAYAAGLRYVEIEVRQDLLATPAGQARISHILASVLQFCRS